MEKYKIFGRKDTKEVFCVSGRKVEINFDSNGYAYTEDPDVVAYYETRKNIPRHVLKVGSVVE